jgi:hypothetical protein
VTTEENPKSEKRNPKQILERPKPKSEKRNPKQIRKKAKRRKKQKTKTNAAGFWFRIFFFCFIRICFGFRFSDFGFGLSRIYPSG